jgi:uncharacterized protein YjdB
MKKTSLFLGFFLVLFATGCADGPLEPGVLDDLEIGLTSLTLSANELATISGNELNLTLVKNPGFANKNTVAWESSNPSAATVDQNGHITAGTTISDVLSAVIKVYAVDDPSIYAVCPVTVYPDYGSDRSWTFTTGAQSSISADTDNTQGMTILAATGGLSAYNDPPVKGLNIIDPDDPYQYGATPSGGARSGVQLNTGNPPGGSDFSNCYLRTNGNSRMFKIAAIQGPFTVTVNYASNGSPGIHVDIRFGDKEGFFYVGDDSGTTSDYRTVSWPYAGDDIVPFVYIETKGSARIYDVIITSGATYPYTPVPDSFVITGADSFVKGETETYTSDITKTLTNPSYVWEITEGNEYAEIAGSRTGESVTIRALESGTVTLQLTVITSNPYDEVAPPKSVSQTKTITIEGYTPVSGVAIDSTASVTEGGTVQLTANVSPTDATNPVYEWIITGGGTYGAIASGGDTKTVTLSGTAQGSFTVKAKVTTTDPANPLSTHTEESNECTVTVTKAAAYDYRWLASEVEQNFTLNSSAATREVNGKTWFRTGGTIAVTSSGFSLSNGRFLIGSSLSSNTSSSVFDSSGEFNFSSAKKKVTIDYSSFTGTANFQIYLNNNTTSQGNSVHEAASKLIDTNAYSNSPGQIVVTIDNTALAHAALATSFLQLRAANGATIVITGITIENAAD